MIGKKKKKKLDAKDLLKIVKALEPGKTTMQIYAETTAMVQIAAPGMQNARSSTQRQSNIKELTPVIERVLLERISSQVDISPLDAKFVEVAERMHRDPKELSDTLRKKLCSVNGFNSKDEEK